MIDPLTLKPRGFGFVQFFDVDAPKRCLEYGEEHFIDGSRVDVKKAVPRKGASGSNYSHSRSGPRHPGHSAARPPAPSLKSYPHDSRVHYPRVSFSPESGLSSGGSQGGTKNGGYKLFVGGLQKNSNGDTLRAYFQKFGDGMMHYIHS
jgi:RNA recognition motif-containing protein